MCSAPARRLPSLLCFLFSVVCLLTATGRAELVWTPQTGWSVEGGALSGLAGAEGRNALDQMNRARTAEEAGSSRSAIRTYQSVAKRYPNSIYAPEALYRSARLRLLAKHYTKAFEDFQQVLARYPNTRRFNEIIGEQYRIASALLDGARGRMLWGLLPGFKQRDKAIEYFETILVNAPYSDYAPLSLMNVARGHQRLGNVENAIDALDRMINNYSQTLLAPDAYLKLAQTHASLVDGPFYDQGATKEAITYFTDFMLLFPSDNSIATAESGLDNMKTMLAESKMRMADFYFYKRSNYKAARVFYNEAITAYPESAIADRAKNRLAEVEAKATDQPPPSPRPAIPSPKEKALLNLLRRVPVFKPETGNGIQAPGKGGSHFPPSIIDCLSPVAQRSCPASSLLLIVCLFVTAGCANYRLGTESTLAFRTLYVEPVANKTLLPQSQPLVSTRLRETFARDPRVQLTNSASGADATLTVVINDYHREIAAVREGDTGLARKFNLTLGAACTLRNNRTGQMIFENRPITAVREAFTDSGQLQAEYQTLPLLAEALATKVVHAALDVW